MARQALQRERSFARDGSSGASGEGSDLGLPERRPAIDVGHRHGEAERWQLQRLCKARQRCADANRWRGRRRRPRRPKRHGDLVLAVRYAGVDVLPPGLIGLVLLLDRPRTAASAVIAITGRTGGSRLPSPTHRLRYGRACRNPRPEPQTGTAMRIGSSSSCPAAHDVRRRCLVDVDRDAWVEQAPLDQLAAFLLAAACP